MATEIWIVRHAATESNLRYEMIGLTDVPLGKTGDDQAKRIGNRLSQIPFAAIYSSPLLRAQQTADCIAKLNDSRPEVKLCDNLREIYFGKFEGISSFQAYDQAQEIMDEALDESVDDFAFPKGELRSCAAKRFHLALCDIVFCHPASRVAIVTHGAVFGCWLSYTKHLPLGTFRRHQPKHASLSKLTVEEININHALHTAESKNFLLQEQAPADRNMVDRASADRNLTDRNLDLKYQLLSFNDTHHLELPFN